MENITIKFNVEIDGKTFAKVAKCLKVHEPEIFTAMMDEFKPQFDKISNGEIRESGESDFDELRNSHIEPAMTTIQALHKIHDIHKSKTD